MDDDPRDEKPWNTAEVVQIKYGNAHPEGKPNLFLQWNGTDVCFDFWCSCGQQSHFDGYFAYSFRCKCGAIYEMPYTLYPLRVEVSSHEPVELDADEED